MMRSSALRHRDGRPRSLPSARSAAAGVLLLLGGCWNTTPPDPALTCTVEAVTDGDTIRCDDGRRVRLLSIDAPEMEQSPYGGEAREKLASIAPPGTRARLELDEERTDPYGRTLAYLYVDGEMANLRMAERGYAVDLVYEPNTRHADTIRAAVADARAAGRGLWGTGGFDCRPRDFRARRCG